MDLGTRQVGSSEAAVATNMAFLALLICLTAILSGWLMKKRGWSKQLLLKLRMAFGVILLQTILTGLVQFVQTGTQFFAWVSLAALGLGMGVPVTFSLAINLVPVRDRGYVAAMITASA
ncbi:MAG TPA: hypothetical protein VH186_35540 [Chloroflexia bacterium]|nr:hypothetical protein [Chloroflexia bacterium]